MAIIKTGVVTGTGSNINVTLGSVPSWVKLYNIDGLCTLDWTKDMPDGYGYKVITAGTNSYIATGGITPLGDDEGLTVSASASTTDGDTTTMTGVRGFTIGTDADINVCGERIKYVAACLGHDSD